MSSMHIDTVDQRTAFEPGAEIEVYLDWDLDEPAEAEGATAAASGRISGVEIKTRPNVTSSDDVLTRSSYLRSGKLA